MATLADLAWTGCGEPVSEERIAEVQRRLGVRFPETFLKCVRTCDGGYAGEFSIDFAVPGFEKPWGAGLDRILSFREPMSREIQQRLLIEPFAWRELGITPWTSIEDYVFDPPEGLAKGLVPFSENGLGDLMCFDWRKGKHEVDPPIVIWLHEFIEEEPVIFLAPNFDAFIASLERKEEDASP